jgi:hypothetical protein
MFGCPKIQSSISLPASRCSNESLIGEPHASFPNALRSVVRWTSKSSAGRQTGRNYRLPNPTRGQKIGSASLYIKDRKSARRRDLESRVLFSLSGADAEPLVLTTSPGCARPAEELPPGVSAVLKNLSDYKEEQAGYSEDYESIYRDPYQHAQKRSCHCCDGSL